MLVAVANGSVTAEKYKEAIQRAGAVFWTGVLGNVECGAFQARHPAPTRCDFLVSHSLL